MRRIESGRGRSFDPAVVDAFLAMPFGDLAEVAAAGGLDLARRSDGPRSGGPAAHV